MSVQEFTRARSFCTCGHTGDGLVSQHLARFTPGHGPCKVQGCGCSQFTWRKFTGAFERHLAQVKAQA